MSSFGLQVMADPWEYWYGTGEWQPPWVHHRPPPPPPPPPSRPPGAQAPRYVPQPPPPGTSPPRPAPVVPEEEPPVPVVPDGQDLGKPDWWMDPAGSWSDSPDSDSEDENEDGHSKSESDKQYRKLLNMVSQAKPQEAKKRPVSASRLVRKDDKKLSVLHESDLIKDTYSSVLKDNFKTLCKSDPWSTDSGEGKNPAFKANKRPNISDTPYKVEEASIRPLKAPKLDRDWSDLSANKPYKNQNFERMEVWEDSTIRCINKVNQMEVFSTAMNEKLEIMVSTLEKCYKLVQKVEELGMEETKTLVEALHLPGADELTEAVKLLGAFNDSRAQTMEHLARRLQWQQFDLILARRDIMTDLLPGDMPEALKELMRNFPIDKYKLFWHLNEVKEKWNKRTEARASRSFYLSTVFDKKKGGGEKPKKPERQSQSTSKGKDWQLSFRKGSDRRSQKRFAKPKFSSSTKKSESSSK